jgi:hypothetical protein
MTNVVSMPKAEVATIDPAIIESIVTKGDLSGLNQVQKVAYYNYRCKQIGLDPSAKPFDLLNLSGKQVLYANAGATQQLCNLHKLSTQITGKERVDDIYLVSVRVTGADGRVSENQGAVSITGLKGDALANAVLKCTTKAIRRSVLAHCGLGMLDETEVETIPHARTEAIVIPEVAHIPTVLSEPVVPTDWPLMVPGREEAYSYHNDADQWVDAFLTMIDKIAANKKTSPEEKSYKLGEFENVNRLLFTAVRDESPGLYDVLTTGIGKARGEINRGVRGEVIDSPNA